MVAAILIASLLVHAPGQGAQPALLLKKTIERESGRAPNRCSQPAAERERLMREAERKQYTYRRLEFIGNRYTRDNVLRQELGLINEGDVFTRARLVESLKSVSRLNRIIYPVKLSDLEIRLGGRTKEVDITICFREREKPRR